MDSLTDYLEAITTRVMGGGEIAVFMRVIMSIVWDFRNHGLVEQRWEVLQSKKMESRLLIA